MKEMHADGSLEELLVREGIIKADQLEKKEWLIFDIEDFDLLSQRFILKNIDIFDLLHIVKFKI